MTTPPSWPRLDPTLRAEAQAAAAVLRLPFRGPLWRGRSGSWLGAGRGSSLEFEDHRAYAPGDDPRHINWQAYARTGVYSMKLYREEVSPAVDVVLDVSASMAIEDAKARRALELLLFAAASAHDAGATLRIFTAAGAEASPLAAETLAADGLPAATAGAGPPDLARIPFRPGSLRVLVTDGLYDMAPDALLGRLIGGAARGVVWMPFLAGEAAPDLRGPVQLVDCESGVAQDRILDDGALERFRAAYARHFALWHQAGRRHGSPVARVPAEGALIPALMHEALAAGAVEA
jgi:uncharacterized protein (DUF58 family)